MEFPAVKKLCEKASNLVTRVIFGPKVRGTVEAVLQDPNVPEYWHILVQTETGTLRHIIQAERALVFSIGVGLIQEEIPYFRDDTIDIHIHGKGVLLLPWSKAERDPFGLNKD